MSPRGQVEIPSSGRTRSGDGQRPLRPPPQVSLRPVGQCIYCGHAKGLSGEHVLAFGLGGHVVLPKASCSRCSSATSLDELHVLRTSFGLIRAQLNLPSRKASKRPTGAVVQCNVEGGPSTLRWVPVSDLPELYPFLKLPPPKRLREPGAEQDEQMFMGLTGPPTREFDALEYRIATAAEVAHHQRHGHGKLHPKSFARVLAKTAFASFVARFGLEGYEPIVRRAIIDCSVDIFEFVGGGAVEPSEPHGALTYVSFRFPKARCASGGEQVVAIADIGLFQHVGLPMYQVVLALIEPETFEQFSRQAPVYGDIEAILTEAAAGADVLHAEGQGG
jgi:hypothetical protein